MVTQEAAEDSYSNVGHCRVQKTAMVTQVTAEDSYGNGGASEDRYGNVAGTAEDSLGRVL